MQGFSGGFFLPAQRSVHCKGGFFSSATRTAAPSVVGAAAGSRGLCRQPTAAAQFPVLFTLPQANASATAARDGSTEAGTKPKPRARRVYDPHEGEEDCGDGSDQYPEVRGEQPPPAVQRSASSSRFVRGRQQQMKASRASSRDENRVEAPPMRPRQGAASERAQLPKPTTANGDINNKFEIAMQELNQIKDEFHLKQQRQTSAPVLPTAQSPPTSKKPSFDHGRAILAGVSIATSNQQAEAADLLPGKAPPLARNLQSPRQRLQVAEMVMRKLYKNNLQTEQQLAAVKAEKEELATRLALLEQPPAQPRTSETTKAAREPTAQQPCQRCSMNDRVEFVLANPPSMETVSRIDAQQLEYLRHLAAEQDRTITSLKVRIEELSAELLTAKQPSQLGAKGSKAKSSSTPRQAVAKLQTKLQDALHESERQRTNYLTLKRDFQHLLALKTKTLYENPQQLHASARELVALMEKQLQQLEREHSMDLSVYNSKLYETEQQSCESYAQQRMLQDEMDRVARDVQQRDALDVEIEQCMATVFARLHHVESENVHLKNAILQN